MQIGEVKRVRLGIFPTPLTELRKLSEELGGPRIFVKRDDLNGLAPVSYTHLTLPTILLV